MKHTYITRSKGGTGERKVRLDTLKIPDLWKVGTFKDDDREKVLDCWHLAADLKRELLERDVEHAALFAVAEAADNNQAELEMLLTSVQSITDNYVAKNWKPFTELLERVEFAKETIRKSEKAIANLAKLRSGW